jgi:hypothetical protein
VALGNSAGFFRFHGSSGSANTSFDLGTGTTTLNNRNGITVTLGALVRWQRDVPQRCWLQVNAPSFYIVGGKNLNTTFSRERFKDASSVRTTTITKVGTGIVDVHGKRILTRGLRR